MQPGNNTVSATATLAAGTPQQCPTEIIIQPVVVLPVNFNELSLDFQKGGIRVLFSTLSEQNNDYFTVEKSNDGVEFAELGIVDGACNSHELKIYEFLDTNPGDGTVYYRIKQTDFDGRIEYSEIKSLIRVTASRFKIGSAGQIWTIKNNGQTDLAILEVVDLSGRIVLKQNIGIYDSNVDVSSLANGLYVVKIGDGNNIWTGKIVKY